MIDWLRGTMQERRQRRAARDALREHSCPTCQRAFRGAAGVPTLGLPACSVTCAQTYNESVAW